MRMGFDARGFLLPAGPPGCGVGVVEVVDRPAFLQLEKDWNALVETTSDAPFYRHEYIRSWLDSFVPGAALKVLTGRDHAGNLVAALPLVAERGFLYGLPVRWLVSPTSTHTARFDLIAADRRSAARAFVRTLADDDTWDVIRSPMCRRGETPGTSTMRPRAPASPQGSGSPTGVLSSPFPAPMTYSRPVCRPSSGPTCAAVAGASKSAAPSRSSA